MASCAEVTGQGRVEVQGQAGAKVERIADAAALGADKLPYTKARLILAGTEVPVEVQEVRSGESFVLRLVSHGEILEEERYESGPGGFRFLGGSGETFDPPIPLVRLPMTVGESWDWTGVAALGPTEKRATAKVTSGRERLNLASGVHDAIKVAVSLSVETSPQQTAKRELTFWIEPNRGVVRREFGAGSTREPRPRDSGDR